MSSLGFSVLFVVFLLLTLSLRFWLWEGLRWNRYRDATNAEHGQVLNDHYVRGGISSLIAGSF